MASLKNLKIDGKLFQEVSSCRSVPAKTQRRQFDRGSFCCCRTRFVDAKPGEYAELMVVGLGGAQGDLGHTHTYAHTCMRTHTYVHTHVCTHMYVHTHTHSYTDPRSQTHLRPGKMRPQSTLLGKALLKHLTLSYLTWKVSTFQGCCTLHCFVLHRF